MMIYKTKRELLESLVRDSEAALDVGFWGQAVKREDPDWPHKILLECAREVWGVDLSFEEAALDHPERYIRASAEDFSFERSFDVIIALDIIEHLSNPGRFLDSCNGALGADGRLIITTPNAFNLFSIAEKIFHREPSVNSDHTMYFNHTTLARLLEKNGWEVREAGYIDTFRARNSFKRRVLYGVHRLAALFTPKYMETIFVIASKTA